MSVSHDLFNPLGKNRGIWSPQYRGNDKRIRRRIYTLVKEAYIARITGKRFIPYAIQYITNFQSGNEIVCEGKVLKFKFPKKLPKKKVKNNNELDYRIKLLSFIHDDEIFIKFRGTKFRLSINQIPLTVTVIEGEPLTTFKKFECVNLNL